MTGVKNLYEEFILRASKKRMETDEHSIAMQCSYTEGYRRFPRSRALVAMIDSWGRSNLTCELCIEKDGYLNRTGISKIKSLLWIDDERLLLLKENEKKRRCEVSRFEWRTGVESPVFVEMDETRNLSLKAASNGYVAYISSFSSQSNVWYGVTLNGLLKTLVEDDGSSSSYVVFFSGKPLVLSNKFDHRFALYQVEEDLALPNHAEPARVFCGQYDQILQVIPLCDCLVLKTIHNCLERFEILDMNLDHIRSISIEPTVHSVIHAVTDHHIDVALTAPHLPFTVKRYSVKDRRERTIVRTFYDDAFEENILTEFVWPKDCVPMTIVRHRNALVNSSQPVLVSPYGCYGRMNFPSFDGSLYSLLKRGVVAVYPHLRGGGEFGLAWHDAGKGARKKQTVEDLAAVVDWLVQEGIAAPEKICLSGRSAGAAICASYANRNPERVFLMSLESPFLNVFESLSNPSAPLSSFDRFEWGQLDDARSLCPLENIRNGLYPHVHILFGRNDTTVDIRGVRAYCDRIACRARSLEVVEYSDKGHSLTEGSLEHVARHRTRVLDFMLKRLGIPFEYSIDTANKR